MTENSRPVEIPGFRLQLVESQEGGLTVIAGAQTRTATCPHCRESSPQIHRDASRWPQDLPRRGQAVRLVRQVRRFRGQNPAGSAVTMCERRPSVAARWAQRTYRLTQRLSTLGMVVGGQAGAGLSHRLGLTARRNTLRRLVRPAGRPSRPTPRVVGLDDVGLRKGQVYGTLVVDGETHRPVDLIRERTSDAVASWLKAHPGLALITRDRSTDYARGVTEGAPQATPVAAGWHVLTKWREALERVLNRLHAA